MHTSRARIFGLGLSALILLLLSSARSVSAQTLEGSKWRIDQEGVDTQVVWWLGSEGRVRTGDLGLILPSYKWRQSGDSFFVTIGDTVRYAAMLMSNRLVGGIRSGRNHPEGWWSGTRADVATPAAVAAAPAPAPAPATTSTPSSSSGVQPLSRPADTVTTPSAPVSSPPAGGRRPLRQILRGDAPAAAPAGDGHQIRRIERAEAANAAAPQAAPATSAGSTDAAMVGSWTRADSIGMFDGFDLTADGRAALHIRGGREIAGTWSSDSMESRILFTGPEGGEVRFVIWTGGPGLRGAVVTANGPRRTLSFHRAEGPVRQPAVRQP